MRRGSDVLRRAVIVVASGCLASFATAGEIREVYRSVKGSVVVIETESKEIDPLQPAGLVDVGGLGSGVLVSEDGKILTASHVVQTADRIVAEFLSGERIPARVMSAEPGADLAMLQLDRRPAVAQVARLGDSDKASVGDEIFIVGAPFGISHTLTVGHVSARRREKSLFGMMFPTELIQTDAAINQGNSGGPMFDMQGRVIGIVSHIISSGGGSEGLGFAISSNMADRLLLQGRSLWSGLAGRMLEGELARIFNVPQERALLVERVAQRSPASHVGLRGGSVMAKLGDVEMVVGGDIVLETQGVSLAEREASLKVRDVLNNMKDGDKIEVKVLRAGEIVTLENFFFRDLLLPSGPDAAED